AESMGGSSFLAFLLPWAFRAAGRRKIARLSRIAPIRRRRMVDAPSRERRVTRCLGWLCPTIPFPLDHRRGEKFRPTAAKNQRLAQPMLAAAISPARQPVLQAAWKL